MREGKGGIEHFHSRVGSETEIGEEEVDVFRFQDLGCLFEICRDIAVESVFERHAEGIAGGFFVVNDEEGFHSKMI
jgi:hypothetical protein|tara:strand:- start:6228 stop:6455 length:228 start_codon:yes stop_codon:yes gene_type:complete